MSEKLLNTDTNSSGEMAEDGKQVNWPTSLGVLALNQLKELGGKELLNGTDDFPIEFNITDEQRLIGVMGIVVLLTSLGAVSTAISIIRDKRKQKN